jgi:hypothetical protein
LKRRIGTIRGQLSRNIPRVSRLIWPHYRTVYSKLCRCYRDLCWDPLGDTPLPISRQCA